MAKKSRRTRKHTRPVVRLSPSQIVREPSVTAVGAGPTTLAAARPEPREVDLREEYRYVVADLKRIGIIAAVMLAVLIALAFVLT